MIKLPRKFEPIGGEEEEEGNKMLAGGNGDKKWREKSVEGEDDIRMVECLRGRLLAERVASKIAKEDAELMGNKLVELERQLRAEIKSRNRAEKKLKFLTKKMESLKISPVLDQLSSSGNSEGSNCSSATSSELKDPEEEKPHFKMAESIKCDINEEMRETRDPFTSEDFRDEISETNIADPGHEMPSTRGSTSSVSSAHSCNKNKNHSPGQPGNLEDSLSSKELMKDDLSQSSMGEKEMDSENDLAEYVDNTLALVPASMPPALQTCELQINNNSVRDVLAALRHAREHLQSSMGRRDGIKSHSVELCGRV